MPSSPESKLEPKTAQIGWCPDCGKRTGKPIYRDETTFTARERVVTTFARSRCPEGHVSGWIAGESRKFFGRLAI